MPNALHNVHLLVKFSLAGERLRDQPKQSALQDQLRAGMVSNGEAALEVDLPSNNTAYWCDWYSPLLTPGTGDPMPQLGLAQETSRDLGG